MTNVLITGVSGFSAIHLIRRLSREENIRLIGTDITPAVSVAIDLDDYLQVDIRHYDSVLDAIKKCKPDWIFNLAGLLRGSGPDIYAINTMGCIHLLEAVRLTAPHARVLLIGSAAEYGIHSPDEMPITEETLCKPVDPYGISKFAMTLAGVEYSRNCNIKVVVARPFNLIGAGIPSTVVVGAVLQRIKSVYNEREPSILIGNLDAQRDFIAVEDAIDAYMLLIKAEVWGQVFNICSGQPRTTRSMIETLLSFSTKRIQLVTDPALAQHKGVPLSFGSADKARQTFGFRPTMSIDHALRQAWDYAINNK